MIKDCLTCGNDISQKKASKKFCSHNCYWISLLKNSDKLYKSNKERALAYSRNNINKTHDSCPDCNKIKLKTAKRCAKCKGVAMSGIKSPFYKGGYENHLWHNKQRRVKKLNAEGSHTLEEWKALKQKYNHMCLCCKKEEPEIVLSEDHIIPLSKNGTDYISNIQPLCRSCNSRKRDKIISYLELPETIMVGVVS